MIEKNESKPKEEPSRYHHNNQSNKYTKILLAFTFVSAAFLILFNVFEPFFEPKLIIKTTVNSYSSSVTVSETENKAVESLSSQKSSNSIPKSQVVSSSSSGKIVSSAVNASSSIVILSSSISTKQSLSLDTVYWTKGGSVYHAIKECSSLRRSTEILCGTVQQAIEAGKLSLCKICGSS